jgi:hypothetical protein
MAHFMSNSLFLAKLKNIMILQHRYQTAQNQPWGDGWQLSENIKRWLLSEIGEYRIFGYRGGSRNKTWNLSSPTGPYYFKLFSRNHRWVNEVSFYKNWGTDYSFPVPKLIGVFEQEKECGILTFGLDGLPFTKGNFDTEIVSSVYRKAGELCKKLEGLEIGQRFGLLSDENILFDDEDNLIDMETASAPSKFVANKIQILLRIAKEQKALTPHEEGLVTEALNGVDVFSGELPVLVNSDFTPSNWIVNKQGDFLGIIDFEKVSWNLSVFSLTRLISKYFPSHKLSKQAFYSGYGANLEKEHETQVKIVLLIDALRYRVKGISLKQKRYVRQSRDIFGRLF